MKSSGVRKPYSGIPVKRRKYLPLPAVILIDLVLVGVGLVLFALFHHVLPRDIMQTGESLPKPTTMLSTSMPTEETRILSSSTPEETSLTQSETTVPRGLWGARFADKFSTGETIRSDHSYQSENMAITIEKVQEDSVTYYVADIYLRDIDHFRTAFAGGTYARGRTAMAQDIAVENDAILAISGDYYGIRNSGIVVRNGELYRESTFEDVLVLYYDGSMKTFTKNEFVIEDLRNNGAWQAWSFGPMLLDNGQVMDSFNSDVNPRNPRGAIGYYEPGHYCFVLVDGRQEDYSIGLTLAQMSQLFYDLGCRVAYNLDGGQSAVMTFMGKVVNQPYKGGRQISDIVYIGE